MAVDNPRQVKGRSLIGASFLEEIGGRRTVERVHDLLYSKLFRHPWLSEYFVNSTRSILQSQQDDFWTSLMGGPKIYGGRSPRDAHEHMFIPADAYAIRHKMLGEAIEEAGVPALFRDQWMALDDGFERAVVKTSADQVRPRFKTDTVIIPPRPSEFPEPDNG